MDDLIFKAVEKNKKKYLDFLKNLISADTHVESMGKSGKEINGQRIIINKFKELGADLDIFEPNYKDISKYKEVNPSHNYKDRPNVVGVIKGTGGGKSLLVNGHIDTVPFDNLDSWICHPLEPVVRNGNLYGRGTCDMKGGLAAAILAIEIIRELGIKLKGDVILESVVDEEGGGNGTLACIAKGYKADAAIIPEPTQLKLSPAHMGWLMYEIEFTGKAIHCGLKWKGVNAIEKCMKVMQGLLELERKWAFIKRHPYLPPTNITFGTINGGTSGSTVPDKCTLNMAMMLPPCEVKGDWMYSEVEAEFMHEIENIVNSDDWLKENPPKMTLYQLGSAFDIGCNHPIYHCVSDNFKKLKFEEPSLYGLESGADARLLTNYGNTPTLIFGPGSIENAHSVNEFIELQQYYDAIKILSLSIIDWCNSPQDINIC
jgi:acetylornithine deacetylase